MNANRLVTNISSAPRSTAWRVIAACALVVFLGFGPVSLRAEEEPPTTPAIISPVASELSHFTRAGEAAPETNRLIVKLNPIGSSEEIGQLLAEINAEVVRDLFRIDAQVWEVASGDIDTIIAQYQDDPRVAFIERDQVITLEATAQGPSSSFATLSTQQSSNTPNDSRYAEQWALHNSGQSGGLADADIDAPEAWSILTQTTIVVGVIDSGIQYTHPDLSANIWTNPGEIPNNGIDDDSNGYIDDIHGWDFFDADNDPDDANGHGTHVAGTIAASSNNGTGVTGVAWSAQLMALRFIGNEGWGYLSDAIAAIEYATLMGADVTNNSWGGGGYYQAMADAIADAEEAGILFVAAAGNERTNNDASPAYPASYELDNVISVASTTRTDSLSSFSNYGAGSVHLGAPGSSILSTVPNGYATYSGTSMASPHVAGAVALVWGANPNESAAQIKERLLSTVDPIPALADKTLTGGRLNVHNALLFQFTAPVLEYSAPSLNFDLLSDEQINQTMALTNSGDADLMWTVEVTYDQPEAAGWLIGTPTAGTLPPGASTAVALEAQSGSLEAGTYTALVTLTSNDDENSVVTFNAQMVVTTVDYPRLSIPTDLAATYWPSSANPAVPVNQIDVPILLNSYDFELGAAIFSLDIDQGCLAFDPTDENEDGLPDSVTSAVANDFTISVLYDGADVDGELDFMLADLNSPIATLPDDLLLTVRFTVLCEPTLAEPTMVDVLFSGNPALSLSDTTGQSVRSRSQDGTIRLELGYWLGDCNGDSQVNAADASATILEIFDGDGTGWLSAPNGTFTGSPTGCDGNQDQKIDAGDLICSVLLIFNGQDACLSDVPLTGNGSPIDQAATNATLHLEQPVVEAESGVISLPIRLESAGTPVGAATFSLWFDTALLALDDRDMDEDGLADGIINHLAGYNVAVLYDAEEGRLDLMAADLSPLPTLSALPDGLLVTVTFRWKEEGWSSEAIREQFQSATPVVDFSNETASSLGGLQGESLPVNAINESVILRNQIEMPTTEESTSPRLYVPFLVQ